MSDNLVNDSIDYTDSVIVVENDSERNDAMGDLTDPSEMTLEDFQAEYVWKDEGVGRTIWFMKPEKDEPHRIAKGWYKGETRSDAIEDCLNTQAELEGIIIDNLSDLFLRRITKLAETGLEGNSELSTWFVTEDGTEIQRRTEVLEFVNYCESWRLEKISMSLLYGIQDKLQESRIDTFNMFIQAYGKEAKNKFKTIGRIIFDAAVKEKTGDAEGTQESLQIALKNVTRYLNVPMLSSTVKTYCMRLFWALIKCHIDPQIRAVLVKWATLISISKSRENAANESTIDNYFGQM